MRFKRISRITLATILATASINSVATAQAGQIMTATVFTHDSKGEPIAGVEFYIASLSSSGTRLEVFKKTGIDGKAKVQTYANVEQVMFYGLIQRRPTFKTTLLGPNETIDFTLPSKTTRKVIVKAATGLPISGLQVTERARESSSCWRSDSRDLCQTVDWITEDTSGRTDENGIASISTFDLPYSRRDSSVIVYYSPFEGTQLATFVSEADYIKNGLTEVTLDDIPSIEIGLPSNVQASKVFDITGTLKEAPTISASAFKGASFQKVRDVFKKVQFESRLFAKNKWGAWKIIGTANVSASGKTKLSKVKLSKGKYQIRISGKGYSLAGKIKTINVR